MNPSAALVLHLADALRGTTHELHALIDTVERCIDESIADGHAQGDPQDDRAIQSLHRIAASVESVARQVQQLSTAVVAIAAQPMALMAREIQEAADELNRRQSGYTPVG